ncbi:hypothetical protein [Streptomyces silvisoli]|uniref:Uncharacterized protein n=1 Tax=Streptomyces silvisoli TaxID=3034235 RepID=A0ABT5ZP52_9ACTN|nr:hypothetical protein [Streptomyces silvisoli]MDF3291605.1 hypothetical protein [Streptomyces silvisoli]
MHVLTKDNNVAAASPDRRHAIVKAFGNALMSAEADALYNAEYGQIAIATTTPDPGLQQIAAVREVVPGIPTPAELAMKQTTPQAASLTR